MEILLIEDIDLDAAAETIEMYFNRIAKPYYERYNNLRTIDEIFNNPPFAYNPADVGGMFDDRCMRGLIVAKLADNPNYSNLVSIYDGAILETENIKSIEDYQK